MEFAQPWALLGLLSVPLIVALHLLRPKRRREAVSTTMLWRAALEERQRRLGFLRLLRDLALLLLVLFALAASVALADPQWLTRSSVSTDVVLVLDVSASMQASDGLGDRFASARREAQDLIAQLPEGGRMLVISAGRQAIIHSAFETDRDVLRARLASIDVTDEAGRPREALALALSLLRGRDLGRVYFITDGAFDPAPLMDSPQIHYRLVGGEARNVAITQFDLRQEVGSDERYQALLTVRNYTTAPVRVPATVELGERRLLERELELAPGAERTVVLASSGRLHGRATARIDVDDDLAADDRAFAAIDADEVQHVLLVTPGNLFLEAVLSAMPGIDLTRTGPQAVESLARRVSDFDVVVLDRVTVPESVSGRFLLVNTLLPGLPLVEGGIEQAPIIAGHGESALMRDVDLSGLSIERARAVTLADDASGVQRLFWSARSELALALLDDDLRAVYLGFDVARSNLPLQAAFPLLMAHSLNWLGEGARRGSGVKLAAGMPHTIRVASNHREITVRRPSGDAEIHPVTDGEWVMRDTRAAGIYRYTVGGIRRYLAVNLTDEVESDIRRRYSGGAAPARADVGATAARLALPIWPWLAAFALALLGMEWFVRCAGGRRA